MPYKSSCDLYIDKFSYIDSERKLDLANLIIEHSEMASKQQELRWELEYGKIHHSITRAPKNSYC
jgi:hypothetical protein